MSRVSRDDIGMIINRTGNQRIVSRMDLALDLRDALLELERLGMQAETPEEKEAWWRRRSEMFPDKMGPWQ